MDCTGSPELLVCALTTENVRGWVLVFVVSLSLACAMVGFVWGSRRGS